jgi:hypothetical protein
VFFGVALQASTLETIRAWYQQGQYDKVCSHETTALYEQYADDEAFVNMYGHACAETDMISRTLNPINKLVKSPETRESAVYLATVLYQKKLLYHALVDQVDISYIRLPKTNHILSTLFDKYITNDFEKKGKYYHFHENETTTHRLHVNQDNEGVYKLIVQTYSNGTLVKTRAYW